MKNLLLILLTILSVVLPASAIEIDTLWYRTMSSGARDVDFTPDDKYVIAWNNSIEFWEVQKGVMEFSVPTEVAGDYNYTEQYLVFAKDSTPKLLDWQTKEVIEGFEKENENIGRIRTAKSKNEFMANTFHINTKSSTIIGNMIYFYDIESKRKVDSLSFVKQFQKDGYKWKRTIHDYDYVGTNDEIIYVVVDDVNDEIDNIPPQWRKRHYFVHFYNRETKELVDSVYSFTNTNEKFGGFNNMQVMNDRSKIAWNHRGGEINFYDITERNFYSKIIFDEADYVPATNIDLSKDDSKLVVTNQHTTFLKIFDVKSNTLIHEYTKGSFQNSSFSDNNELLITNIGGFLILFPSHINTSSVEGTNYNQLNLTVTPNPASNNISIQFSTATNESIKLSIIDLLGNEIGIIDEGNIENQNYSINYNISNLAPATYFIRLELGSEIFTKKFIKE